MNRLQLNLVLMGVVAALLIAVVYYQRKSEKTSPPLTSLKADAITHVRLDKPGAKRLELARSGAVWRFTAPIAVDADPAEVKSLTGIAETPDEQTIPKSEVKLSELGLDPPQYTLTLDTIAIAFGNTEPIRYRRYVLLNGVVHLITDPASAVFSGDWANLVSKSVVPSGDKIRRIEVPGFSVARTADDQPWVLTPARPQVAAGSLNRFAEAWAHARAMWNTLAPADKPAPTGEHVRVVLSGGQALDLVVAARDPQLSLARPDLGVTYVLSKDDEAKLLTLASTAPGGAASSAPAASGTTARLLKGLMPAAGGSAAH